MERQKQRINDKGIIKIIVIGTPDPSKLEPQI